MGRGTLTPQEEELKRIVSNNIKLIIEREGVSQAEFARRAKIPPTTLSGYVKGVTRPNAGNIQKISDTFGVPKADIDPSYKKGYTLEEWEQKQKTSSTLSEINRISSQLEEPRQQKVLDTAKLQLTEQEKAIEEAKKRERKILGLDSKPIDITKIPGYMPYEPDKMGTAPILGEIAAGYDIMAEENFEGMMPVSAEYAGRDDVFWLNIKGSSMESLIHDGTFGLFECSDDIYDGRIGAVMSEDGEWITVKRIYHNYDENGYLLGLTLVPENDECPTIEINEYNPGKIIGTLLEVKQYF